ncbi:glycosyltransferase family 39 protein [Clostridium sp. 19966]|uniref:glycosyltransferase family 39 protein n=1 Tax=Clostridium sp. 19966 TaxID=2768166 RepID=UPI0028DF63C2|nr:glycosyltransferase family 39 protein [Clostridium sp. 19966]MDT8716310.1 glycosyltransferase family 39 protein [Clostridium sp. 19966]
MFTLKNESKKIKIILASCCALLFLMTLVSIFYYGNSTLLGNIYSPDNDDVKFIRSAKILLEQGIYTYHHPPTSTVFMMPGLPFALAFLMKIFGFYGGITALRIVQAVLQTVSLLIIFYIGRKMFNSKIAILAVIFDTFYIAEIYTANLVLTETFFKFFVLCLVLFSIYALEENKMKFYLISGLFWGLSTLFRPAIATYPILILIMWIIKKARFIDCVKYGLAVTLVFCAVLSPWWIRNYKVFHQIIPLTMASGNPMLQGTYINYDQSTQKTDGLNYKQFHYGEGTQTELQSNATEVAISKYRLKNLFPKEPLKFIYWYTIGKSWAQINFPFYWKPLFGISYEMAGLYHFLMLILAVIGSLFYFKNKSNNKLPILLIAIVIYFDIDYLPFFTMGRYFYPAAPYFIIMAAYAVFSIKERISAGKSENQIIN